MLAPGGGSRSWRQADGEAVDSLGSSSSPWTVSNPAPGRGPYRLQLLVIDSRSQSLRHSSSFTAPSLTPSPLGLQLRSRLRHSLISHRQLVTSLTRVTSQSRYHTVHTLSKFLEKRVYEPPLML
ncbi:uncharacterized protein LOC133822080 isoform X2 [Humulus lupulus]|uniref:uncharacterized protein LOC133822080 isoform X2 n=1 Tax=Humulus lupulus TaxID=3486 RepID=UPI002B40833A|nr:uncharacterized protein LOC133822080 isoform X2 [Humulus lupulus]